MKEVKTLYQIGFEITVIWSPISIWADPMDDNLFDKYNKVKWIQAGYHEKRQSYLYFFSRIRKKIWFIVYKLFGDIFSAALKSSVLFSQELIEKAVRCRADVYIGHNLGALPAVVLAAKKFNGKSIFDFEDYHRGEFNNGSTLQKRVICIENEYISLVDCLTTASRGISNAYKTVFQNKNILTINNVFPLAYSNGSLKKLNSIPLKLFWFSQYIGRKRGIENVLKAMAIIPNKMITLSLMGVASDEIKEYFRNLLCGLNLDFQQLTFIDPVPECEIAQVASLHHIGICAEYVHIPNLDLCLANKIFMYLLSGNAVVMTDTRAQKQFMEENPNVGMLYRQENAQSLADVLQSYIDSPDRLMDHRQNALHLALTKYNWDNEQHLFIDNIERTLNG